MEERHTRPYACVDRQGHRALIVNNQTELLARIPSSEFLDLLEAEDVFHVGFLMNSERNPIEKLQDLFGVLRICSRVHIDRYILQRLDLLNEALDEVREQHRLPISDNSSFELVHNPDVSERDRSINNGVILFVAAVVARAVALLVDNDASSFHCNPN